MVAEREKISGRPLNIPRRMVQGNSAEFAELADYRGWRDDESQLEARLEHPR